MLLSCSSTPHRPDQPEVKSLHIEGTHQVSEGDIKDKILTEATSWLPFASKKYFDANAWLVDLRRIQRFYQGLGYAPGSHFATSEEKRPIQTPGLSVQVPLQ